MLKGVSKITDLGLSKLMKTSGMSSKSGTPFYLAPEVFHSEKYDKKADIWSFGIMTLELLVGKRIYDMVKGMLAPSLIENFPSEALLNQIKDKEMRELVELMLKKKPEERLSSQEVLNFLKGDKGKVKEVFYIKVL
jgi:serine/threonine protein kinase